MKEKIQEEHQEIEKDYTSRFEQNQKSETAKEFNDQWNKGDHA